MNKDLCAVDGCEKEGKPQVCPHDGRMHHHGRIHYDCGYPVHSLKFRSMDEGWFLICDEHYQVVASERLAFASKQA